MALTAEQIARLPKDSNGNPTLLGSGGGLSNFSIGGVLNEVGESLGLGPNKGTVPTYNDQYNLPGYQQQYGQYGRLASGFGGRQAPQANAFTAGAGSFRADQRGFGRDLRREARGRGIGQQTVRMQAQNMADRALAQQYGMAAGARPGMGGGAYQNAAMNAANAQSRVGEQAAMAGAQMQLGAMNQYGGFLQGARGQDQQLGMFNAGQRQQGSQFNTDAQLRQMGLNDQAQLEALRQRLQAAGMQQQGGLAFNQALQNYNTARMGQPTAGQALLGAGMGAAQMYAGMPPTAAAGGARPGDHGSTSFNPYNY